MMFYILFQTEIFLLEYEAMYQIILIWNFSFCLRIINRVTIKIKDMLFFKLVWSIYYNMKRTSSYQHWQSDDSQHNFGDLNSYDFYFFFLLLLFYISCVVKLNKNKRVKFMHSFLGAIYGSQLFLNTAALKLLVFGNIILFVFHWWMQLCVCIYLGNLMYNT